MEVKQRQGVVDRHHHEISISRQCQLLSIKRSSLYYQAQSSHFDWDEPLKQEIRLIMLEFPYYVQPESYGSFARKRNSGGTSPGHPLTACPGTQSHSAQEMEGRKTERASRPSLPLRESGHHWPQSGLGNGHYLYPHSLWVGIPAIMDLYSRMILGWQVNGTLEAEPCIQLLKDTVRQYGPPQILNQDQGSQFTSQNWLDTAENFSILISMASKGRCYDNIHVERGWRSLKQEVVYLKDYHNLGDARINIGRYIQQYNYSHLHQALEYRTPASVYNGGSLWNQSTPEKEVQTDSLLCV
jgi:putative transposase